MKKKGKINLCPGKKPTKQKKCTAKESLQEQVLKTSNLETSEQDRVTRSRIFCKLLRTSHKRWGKQGKPYRFGFLTLHRNLSAPQSDPQLH